jgi:hypothetical protein
MVGEEDNAPWIQKARAAKRALNGKKHGARESSLMDAGWKDANTARRAIAAFDYVESLRRDHLEEHRLLCRAPVSIVELLARWRAFDAEGALGKAREWALSRYSVRDLADDLAKVRRSKAYAGTREEVADTVRAAVKGPLTTRLKGMLAGKLEPPMLNFKAAGFRPVDFHFERFVQETGGLKIRTVAAIIVGPFQNSSLYSKRRHEWIVAAFGTAWFFDTVALVVPSAPIAEEYSDMTKSWHARALKFDGYARAPDVRVVEVRQAGLPRLTPEDEDALVLRAGHPL